MIEYFAVPFFHDLTSERGWSRNGSSHDFFVARMHFALKRRSGLREIQRGPVLAAWQTAPGVTIEQTQSTEVECTNLELIETMQQVTMSDEVLRTLGTSMAAKVSNIPFALETSFKSEVQHKLVRSSMQSYKFSASRTNRVKIANQLKWTLAGASGHGSRLVVAAPYVRVIYDLILTYADYLSVEYRRSHLGLRKKRKKLPPHPGGGEAPNWIKFNLPFATVECWELIRNGQMFIPESEYSIDVEDPSEVIISAPVEQKTGFVAFPSDLPTLYQLSTAAFPLRWIDRKGPWTVEELKALEAEEAHETAWAWEGTRRRGR